MASCKHCKSAPAKATGFCCPGCKVAHNAPRAAARRLKAEAEKVEKVRRIAEQREKRKAKLAEEARLRHESKATLAQKATTAFAAPVQRTCPHCWEKFSTTHPDKRYCTKLCAERAAEAKRIRRAAQRERMTELPEMAQGAELTGSASLLDTDPEWHGIARPLVAALPCRPVDLRTIGHRQALAWAEGARLARYSDGEWRRTRAGDMWISAEIPGV